MLWEEANFILISHPGKGKKLLIKKTMKWKLMKMSKSDHTQPGSQRRKGHRQPLMEATQRNGRGEWCGWQRLGVGRGRNLHLMAPLALNANILFFCRVGSSVERASPDWGQLQEMNVNTLQTGTPTGEGTGWRRQVELLQAPALPLPQV